MPTIRFRGTRAELVEALQKFVAALGAADSDAVRSWQLRLGMTLLSQIRQDFIVKSRGGVGRDGIVWPPLKPETIAQRRTTAGERKSLGITGRRVRGLLTPDQDRRWRGIYSSTYQRLVLELGHTAAAARAAQSAWAILKAEGAQTKLATLGTRQVDILRDTGLLLRSLTPPSTASSSTDGQILEANNGLVSVGSTIHPWHHRGVPGKLPARPFWPLDGRIPDVWWEAITRAALRGLLDLLTLQLERGQQ